MDYHKHQALQAQQVFNYVELKLQGIMQEILMIEEKVSATLGTIFSSSVHFKYFGHSCVARVDLT